MSKLARTLLDVQSLDLRDMPSFFGGISLHGFGFSAPECKPVAVNCQPIKVIDCAPTPPKPVNCAPTPPKPVDCVPTPPKPVDCTPPKPVDCAPTPPKKDDCAPKKDDCAPKKDDGKCDLFGGYEPKKDKDDKYEACGYGYKPNTGDKCDDKGDKDKKDDCAADLIKNLKAKACAVVSALCGIGHGW